MNYSETNNELIGTRKFIKKLTELKEGDLGILRTLRGQRLDETLDGFDLFTGLWWSLRSGNHWSPEREVSWLISKIYAQFQIPYADGYDFSSQLGKCANNNNLERFSFRFDNLLQAPIDSIEPYLRWGVGIIYKKSKHAQGIKLDWVQLVNDLSNWNNEGTRRKWAENFIKTFINNN